MNWIAGLTRHVAELEVERDQDAKAFYRDNDGSARALSTIEILEDAARRLKAIPRVEGKRPVGLPR